MFFSQSVAQFHPVPVEAHQDKQFHQKLNGTESQRTPKEVARAIRFSGLGVRSVGPVGDFLEQCKCRV